jgi:purine-binding chemotaxis protein CheW
MNSNTLTKNPDKRQKDMTNPNDSYMEEETVKDRYLCFSLGTQGFGVPISQVKEIVEMQEITPVPHMPTYIQGVINLRGQIIPLLDLRLRMGMDFRDYDRRTCIVIVQHKERQVGMAVDRMEEVLHFRSEIREQAPDYRSVGELHKFIDSLGRYNERVLMLLDPQAILRQSAIPEGSDGN